MARKHKPEVHEFIMANYRGRRVKELTELTNSTMGTEFTVTAMKSYLSNRGLKNGMPRHRAKGEGPSKYPQEMESFIRSVAQGKTTGEIAEITAEHFGIDFDVKKCKAYMGNHRITNGVNCQFKKGHHSFNKGKKQSEFMTQEQIERTKATRFKKGDTPYNHLEVGSIVTDSDGYLKKKIGEPNKWKHLHRLVWEEAHGPVPKGMIVAFKDGNKANCDIGNLYIKSRAEHAVMNHLNLQSECPELTEVGLTIAKLKVAQSRAKKRKRKEDKA